MTKISLGVEFFICFESSGPALKLPMAIDNFKKLCSQNFAQNLWKLLYHFYICLP